MTHMPETMPLHRLPAFHSLKAYLIELTGLGYYQDKDGALAQHVQRHLTRLNFSSLAQYLEHIRAPHGQEDLDHLLDDIAIGETYFFRNAAQFDALRHDILPERIASVQGSRTLKIWSAGCASGAEPYSVSILLDRMSPDIRDADILGTDLCDRRLHRAREAVFTEWELRGLPEELRSGCFSRQGTKWVLKPRFARGVTFRQQNLMEILNANNDNVNGVYDIILCRNVLIYFDVDLMRRILSRLRDLLVDGGWLLVGHSEPFLEIAHFLTPVSVSGTTAYRRVEGAHNKPLHVQTSSPVSTPPLAGLPEVRPFAWFAAAPEGRKEKAGSSSVDEATVTVRDDNTASAEPLRAPQTSVVERDPLEDVRRLADAGDWLKAVDCCTAYIADNQLNPAGHFLLGLILEHQGQHDAAFQAMKRVVYLDRGHALAHFHLGRLHAQAGDDRQARRAFSNARDLIMTMLPGTPLAGGDGLVNDELESLVCQHLERLTE